MHINMGKFLTELANELGLPSNGHTLLATVAVVVCNAIIKMAAPHTMTTQEKTTAYTPFKA